MKNLVNLAKGLLVDKPAQALRSNGCLLCHAPISGPISLCAPCIDTLPRLPGGCVRCAEPLPAGSTGHCARCLQQRPAFDAVQAGWWYQQALPYLIHGLKFHAQLTVAHSLGGLFAQRLQASCDVLLPVPLHHKRLTERGYNQAMELALPIARQLRMPIDNCGVKRSRATAPQPGKQAAARQRNLRGAFDCSRQLGGLRVAVIDDVMTTGATANELAKLLKRQGASRVEIWPLARAGRSQH